jgi:hypothetical protein
MLGTTEMLKIYLKLRAKRDIYSGWKKGEICEMENDVFNKNTGIAYHSIDKDWEIIKMEIKEFKEVHI